MRAPHGYNEIAAIVANYLELPGFCIGDDKKVKRQNAQRLLFVSWVKLDAFCCEVVLSIPLIACSYGQNVKLWPSMYSYEYGEAFVSLRKTTLSDTHVP